MNNNDDEWKVLGCGYVKSTSAHQPHEQNHMLPEQQRRHWTDLRFQFYLAARTLWLDSQHQMGGLNFGYAIELSLKHLCHEGGAVNGKIARNALFNHSVKDLTALACSNSLLAAGTLSPEFIDYVDDVLNTRYPSQIETSLANAHNRGHLLHHDICYILAFDDAVLEIDAAIERLTGDSSSSVISRALTALDLQGKTFFHGNQTIKATLTRVHSILDRERQRTEEQWDRSNPHLLPSISKQFGRIEDQLRTLEEWAFNPLHPEFRGGVVCEGPLRARNFRNTSRIFTNAAGEIVGGSVGHQNLAIEFSPRSASAEREQVGYSRRRRRRMTSPKN